MEMVEFLPLASRQYTSMDMKVSSGETNQCLNDATVIAGVYWSSQGVELFLQFARLNL